jgi:hypothetical protein
MKELDRIAADIDDHDLWFRQKVTGVLSNSIAAIS